jgi:hypothetical protein
MTPTTHEEHWAKKDPEAQPPRAAVAGFGRQVTECKLRLGHEATPEKVAEELRAGGVEVSEEEVRRVWDEGA